MKSDLMAPSEVNSLLHWNYFLALESDLERLARSIEFTADNFNTYSTEIAHLLLASASEAEVVAKQLCYMNNPERESCYKKKACECNVPDYRKILHEYVPDIEKSIVTIPRYDLNMQPWDNWQHDANPDWWKEYNLVKHQRYKHYSKANLKNLIDAMAGLFVMLLYYHKAKGPSKIEPPPKLFLPTDEIAMVCVVMGGGIVLSFK